MILTGKARAYSGKGTPNTLGGGTDVLSRLLPPPSHLRHQREPPPISSDIIDRQCLTETYRRELFGS
jgi:hypothetical protein